MATAQTKDMQNYDIPLISLSYANLFFSFLKAKGITNEAIIAHAPEAANLIRKSAGHLSINQMIPIIETSDWLLNDEGAAFEFGQQLDLGKHGLFGYSLLTNEDFQQKVETIVKHMQICLPLFEMEVVRNGRDTIIHLNDTWDIGKTRSFIAKMYMGSIYSVSKQICSNLHFDIDFPSTKTEAEWASLAPNSYWNFNTDKNCIILSQVKQVNPQQKNTDKELTISYSLAENNHLQKSNNECENTDKANNIATKVREHIKTSPNLASIERSASLLNMSSRYLRQQLANENTSFREISNEVRQGYADLYLNETPMPLNKIANKLGFGDQASFTRAYRSWTGKTPGEVRKELKKEIKAL
ncbi:MAG: AraC-like DNA-binding protein [Pseudohongiellaceae bacterium]|jgi:AraC-like DNA-binding protein